MGRDIKGSAARHRVGAGRTSTAPRCKEARVNARIHAIVLDCPNPQALAEFYSQLTGWKLTRDDGDWVELRGDGDIRLSFQLAPDHQPPAWPDPNRPQQYHIDFI